MIEIRAWAADFAQLVAAENAPNRGLGRFCGSFYPQEIRFGAATKMGRTTWNSSIAVPVQLRLSEQAAPDCRKQKRRVETENGNHCKEDLPLEKGA